MVVRRSRGGCERWQRLIQRGLLTKTGYRVVVSGLRPPQQTSLTHTHNGYWWPLDRHFRNMTYRQKVTSEKVLKRL